MGRILRPTSWWSGLPLLWTREESSPSRTTPLSRVVNEARGAPLPPAAFMSGSDSTCSVLHAASRHDKIARNGSQTARRPADCPVHLPPPSERPERSCHSSRLPAPPTNHRGWRRAARGGRVSTPPESPIDISGGGGGEEGLTKRASRPANGSSGWAAGIDRQLRSQLRTPDAPEAVRRRLPQPGRRSSVARDDVLSW